MDGILSIVILVVAAGAAALAWAAWRTARQVQARLDQFGEVDKSLARTERLLLDELARNRQESLRQAQLDREEIAQATRALSDSLQDRMTGIATLQKQQLDIFAEQLATLTRTGADQAERLRSNVDAQLKGMREDNTRQLDGLRVIVDEKLQATLRASTESSLARMTEIATLQKQQLDSFANQIAALTRASAEQSERLRATVDRQLLGLREDNARQLEQMRATVDEKLQATLNVRLAESFRQVSERLEQVHKGLGEMNTLAAGVGDLKKVLTNVKTRGTWGEIQLGNLLEQVLAPGQYEANVATKAGSAERVEFAIRLPGREGQEGQPVWLPVDAKFPQEDYQRLVEAQEAAEAEKADTASRELERRIRNEAKQIREKYVDPPGTTDFAIMFLPTEGLFAEIIRRPGLCEALQRDHRVIVAGPTTLAALLNSLQMGFRTMAIEQRSREVWALLGTVKQEFGKFGGIIGKVQKKLQEATNTIDDAARKTKTIERKLKAVEALPAGEAAAPALDVSPDAEE